MVDTGFSTPNVDRLGTCYGTDPRPASTRCTTRPTASGSKPPAFPSGAGGLVSTIDDVHAFGRMLLAGGRLPDGSTAAVAGLDRQR